MRIRSFSEARGIFESEEFSLEPHIYCFGGPGDNGGGGGGSTHPGRPGGESGERGNRSDLGDGNDRDYGDDERNDNDNDNDGIPNSIDATPGTPSTGDDAFSSVGAAYDEAVASIAAGEDAFGPGGAAGRDDGDDGDDGGNDRDNDGIPDTIDIDAGTGTGTPLDGVDIFEVDESVAAPEIEAPDPMKVANLLTEIARDQQTGNIFGAGPESTVQGPPADARDLGVLDNTYTPDRVVSETVLGPAPETQTLGGSLVDSLFEGLAETPETFTPEDLLTQPTTNVPPTGEITISGPQGLESRTTLGETPVKTATTDLSLAPVGTGQPYTGRDAVDQSIDRAISDFLGQRVGATAEMAPDGTVTREDFSLMRDLVSQPPAFGAAYSPAEQLEMQEGALATRSVDLGPDSINVFGMEIPTGIGVAEGIINTFANPTSQTLEALKAGAEPIYSADGTTVIGAYDRDSNVVFSTEGNRFRDEMEPYYQEKKMRDDEERARQGDDGQQVAQDPVSDISCPDGYVYDPVSDSCVPKERARQVYRGPSTVDIAVPTLTQYTQMAAPRPAALGPSQLIAPRPIDPLTGRPFRDGGIVNVAKFANGGKVSVAKFAEGGRVTSSDIAYLQGLVQAGDRNVSDFVSAIENYIGTSTSELPESIQTALKVREQLRPIEADVFEKYGFDRSQYDKFMNRGMKGIGEDRSFATNSYFVYNPTNNQQMVSNTDGMTIENADAMRSLLRVMDQYNSSTGGAYGSDKQNIRLNFTSGDKFDLLVDGRKLGNFSGSSEGMQDAADSMVSYLSGAYAAPELSQVYQAKQQMQSLPTYEGQSAYKDLAQQTLNSIVGLSDTQDWMDINKDDQVNISDAVKLLKYGSGVEEVPDDIFMLTPQGQIASLQDKYGQLENTYNTLTTDYGAVTGSMRDLEEQLATQTQQTEALQNQLTGMEGYVDPSQFEGYIDPETYAQATGQVADLQTQLSGLEGYVDPETYGNLQTQLDQKIADYNTLNTTYGTTQADLDKAANEISQLQSQLSDLTGQKQQAQQMAEQRRVQGLVQQYGQPTDYTQFAPPAQSFMPQAAQTSRPTQYAPPAGIAGLQTSLTPTVLPALDMPQFTPQPALDIPLLELAQLDPLAPVPYAPPSLYNPFVPPSQNFGS